MTRNLAAQFLPVVGGAVVAVDRLQPVAALLATDGTLLDLVSWADRREPPAEWVWPNRRVAALDDRVLVQDLPDEQPVALVVGDGRFRSVEDAGDAGRAWRHPRLFQAVPVEVDGWTFGGQRIDNRLWCWVERNGRRWTAGDGSVVARAAGPSWALAAIRRAPVRPWAFDPEHELVALSARPAGLVPARLPPTPVDAQCWPVRDDRDEALAEYLPWTDNLVRVIESHGGRDVRREVHGSAVDIVFRLGDWALLREMTLTALRSWFDDAERHLTT